MKDEKEQWGNLDPTPKEPPAVTAVSYSALVFTTALVVGGLAAAFPYIWAIFIDEDHRALGLEEMGDSAAKGWWRFGAGAIVGAVLMIGYLIYQRWKKDEGIDEKDPFQQ